jgi:hypothetical protein
MEFVRSADGDALRTERKAAGSRNRVVHEEPLPELCFVVGTDRDVAPDAIIYSTAEGVETAIVVVVTRDADEIDAALLIEELAVWSEIEEVTPTVYGSSAACVFAEVGGLGGSDAITDIVPLYLKAETMEKLRSTVGINVYPCGIAFHDVVRIIVVVESGNSAPSVDLP